MYPFLLVLESLKILDKGKYRRSNRKSARVHYNIKKYQDNDQQRHIPFKFIALNKNLNRYRLRFMIKSMI